VKTTQDQSYNAFLTLYLPRDRGTLDQWISIRGQSRSNPAVLLLHQGGGQAQSSFPRNVFFSWTRNFTVVRWDQRGAGLADKPA